MEDRTKNILSQFIGGQTHFDMPRGARMSFAPKNKFDQNSSQVEGNSNIVVQIDPHCAILVKVNLDMQYFYNLI